MKKNLGSRKCQCGERIWKLRSRYGQFCFVAHRKPRGWSGLCGEEKAPWRGTWESRRASRHWSQEEGSWGVPGERATFEGRPGDGFASTQPLRVEGFLLFQLVDLNSALCQGVCQALQGVGDKISKVIGSLARLLNKRKPLGSSSDTGRVGRDLAAGS